MPSQRQSLMSVLGARDGRLTVWQLRTVETARMFLPDGIHAREVPTLSPKLFLLDNTKYMPGTYTPVLSYHHVRLLIIYQPTQTCPMSSETYRTMIKLTAAQLSYQLHQLLCIIPTFPLATANIKAPVRWLSGSIPLHSLASSMSPCYVSTR